MPSEVNYLSTTLLLRPKHSSSRCKIQSKSARRRVPFPIYLRRDVTYGFESTADLTLVFDRAIAEVYWFKELPASLRTWVWELFEQNMKAQ